MAAAFKDQTTNLLLRERIRSAAQDSRETEEERRRFCSGIGVGSYNDEL